MTSGPERPSPPIVYAGPSISPQEVAAALPGAEVRAPIRRWDLYRDREAGGSVFVILDGVFFQQEAVSPREILDVLADGALVVGAASMGALRAAECWPAGMAGVGAIYRLFRRGLLTSDDEVAVTFAPGFTFAPPAPSASEDAGPEDSGPVSVALVNVRHAASRAVREGWMERALAQSLVRAAEETFYAEREWPALLARAGAPRPAELAPRLAALDLKKKDALHALRRVARWLAADPALAHRPRPRDGPFVPRDGTRERAPDALAGADLTLAQIRRDLARWHLLSGRGARHLLAVAAVRPELRWEERLRQKGVLGALVEQLRREPGRPGTAGAAGAAALQMALFELWVELATAAGDADAGDAEGFATALWAELTLAGELDAEILRRRAVRDAAAEARRLGLAPRGRDRYLAEMEIATAHGFPSWRELRQAVRRANGPWPLLVECRDELALAKRLRERLFNPAPAPALRSPR